MVNFSNKVKDLNGSAIRDLLSVIENDNMISFAGGTPSPETFPKAEFAEIATEILLEKGNIALQYGATEGYAPFMEQVRARLKKQGIYKDGDGLLITCGGQQGISLAAKILLNEGDLAVCENPSYVGGLNAFRQNGARLEGIDLLEDGINIDRLKSAEFAGMKLLYTIPTFQNPAGITMSERKREQLLEAVRATDAYIIEDNPYGELRFAGEEVPTIKQIADRGKNNNVIYIGTFSKILSPGLRLGYVVATPEIIDKMTVCKQADDVHTGMFSQVLASEYMSRYDIDAQIAKTRALYKEKYDIMQGAIAKFFPDSVQVTKPQGGLFLWVDGDLKADCNEISRAAIAEGVAIVPGNAFMADINAKTSAFRLNYSAPLKEQIQVGIERLGRVLCKLS
ncbi:MAG: PLP-dependent aminotransferase family protein [Clostridiales bacterium]|jgi:2-aminoadipate transaminase|nr:PLP-dependent aminotransferase family protein [Clostridiales bacterium]